MEANFYVYMIYYGDDLVYVGRTNNISNRIRQHILSGKLIDVKRVSKIEFSQLDTESDMNLYELYYILKYKPVLNDKDTAKDELNIVLDDLEFKPFYSHLYEQWKFKAIEKQNDKKETQFRLSQIKSLLENEQTEMGKEILETQYYILNDR